MSQTVARAIDIIGYVSQDARSLTEVAERLDVHKSTALRLLQTLEEDGFVRRLGDGRYVTGFELIALGQRALEQVEVRTVAHEPLRALARRCGHTVHLGQLVGDTVVYVDKVDGNGTVAMGSRIGMPAATHTAAVAKVICAYQPDPQRQTMVRSASFERYTATTITSADALETDLQGVVRRGWAEDDGEHEDYINCVALPIFDSRNKVTYGMSVTALRASASLAALRHDIAVFQDTAHQISRDLGWKGTRHARR